jgi:hypothetical protein
MHGNMNIKFVNAKQAKGLYQYRNTRQKLYKTNAAIWYNKICREKQLTPNYFSIKINGKNTQCQKNNKSCHPKPPEPRINIPTRRKKIMKDYIEYI